MPKLVVKNAMTKCSQGVAPSTLNVVRPAVTCQGSDVAVVDDYVPNMNIKPFGMCKSMDNPQVKAATQAANGVLTPMPCVPMTTQAWDPGSKKLTISGKKALTDKSKVKCKWNGDIEITNPGQTACEIP